MFVCEIIDTVGGTLSGLGILDLPVVGDILISILDLLWDVFGCGA